MIKADIIVLKGVGEMAVTQEQIAKLAGVSRGTVDRVLNHRGHVNPEVAERIQQISREMGYQPNRAGIQLVRSKRPLRIGVVIQSVETSFMNDILNMVENAREEIRSLGAELVVCPITGVDVNQQIEIMKKLKKEKIDGIAITPVEDNRVCGMIDKLYESHIPVVTFNTDMPDSKRLCYVGQDNYQSGRACAGLMDVVLNGRGTVLLVSGYESNLSHRRRVDGFLAEMRAIRPELKILPVMYCNDNQDTAYKIVYHALKEKQEITGIYFAANGQSGACQAIEELGLKGKVHFICHDWTEDNAANTRRGLIDFFVDQNAREQALSPLRILCDYLLVGTKPPSQLLLTGIDYYNRYNI